MNVANVNQITNGAAAPAKKRMSLDNVRKGRIEQPFRCLLYGPEKVGKSTFAAGAPGAIFLGKDSGTEHLDIVRMPQPDTWGDVREALAELRATAVKQGFKTLVVDPINWFQPMAIASFTGGNPEVNLATWGGGHGAGYQALETAWRIFLKDLEGVWLTGMNIILLAHAAVKRFDDPQGPAYERYELELEKKVAGPTKQWVDHILFAKRESFGKIDPNTKKAKAYGSAARMLYTEWNPAYDAGNRAELPPELPLDWNTFADALVAGQTRIDQLRAQIDEGLRELADAEVEKKVRAWLAEPNVNVAGVANAVAAKLGEHRAQLQTQTKEG